MATLETPRLLLHDLTPETRKALFLQRTEEEIRTFLGVTTDTEWATELQKHAEGLSGYRRSFLTFYIQEKASGKTIGSCGFHTWYLPHRRAEIGYMINDEQWKRKGFMTEALRPIIRYGFEVMDLNRIEAFTSLENIASQKLLKALGFKEEGLIREHYCKNGIIEDSVIFGLLHREFEF